MRRLFPQSAPTCIGLALAAGLLALSPLQPAAAAEKPAEQKAGQTSLPLKRVVLYNAGVGFFEHTGQIKGDAAVEMNFKTDNINDLLKSMVVEDAGGQVAAVSYGSKDPITRTLQSFAIDLTQNPTLADLLNQVRGEKVEVEVPSKVVGTIVGVEIRKEVVDKDRVVESRVLTLLTDEGLRSVNLDAVSRIQLQDQKLNEEFRKALSVLAQSHSTDKKTVTVSFTGEGDRKASIGYIQETPIWKTSYRLVLSDDKAPYLQGWAIVENTTEDDWKDVGLTLMSGRPVSFVMDLYEPLYVPRPVVQPELYASLRPQTYGQDLAGQEQEFRKVGEVAGKMAFGAVAATPAAPPAPESRLRRAAGRELQSAEVSGGDRLAELDLRAGVKSLAAGGDVGELFQYQIAAPVSLPRRQSAMLPIVTGEVKGEKLSIYNQSVQPKHPLNGLRMTNTTKLHLMQGPITVFDGGAYAGDARIEDLPPGSERLVSYALDLDVEVAPESKPAPDELVEVKIVKGTMIVTRKYQQKIEYTVKNSAQKPRKVLIEYPKQPQWNLVQPKEPAETTRDLYRFAVEAKPGEPAKLALELQRMEDQRVALSNIDDNTILIYARAKEVSAEVKAALQEVMKRKQELQQLAQQKAQLDQEIKTISEEQTRIRQNMERLDRTSELYKRYVQKFTEQEDRIEKLREQIEALQQKENQLRKSLDDYLVNLDVK